jgi:hypothetical protein
MKDPAESFCNATAEFTKLAEALRNCSKEDRNHIAMLCTSIRGELGNIRLWALSEAKK